MTSDRTKASLTTGYLALYTDFWCWGNLWDGVPRGPAPRSVVEMAGTLLPPRGGALYTHVWEQPKERLLLRANVECFRIKEINSRFSWPYPLLTRTWKTSQRNPDSLQATETRRWLYPLRSVVSYWSPSVCWAAQPLQPQMLTYWLPIGNRESLCVLYEFPNPTFLPSFIPCSFQSHCLVYLSW